MIRILFAIVFFAFVTCKTTDVSEECTDPGNCSQCFKIYDEQNKFVNQGSIVAGGGIYWAGTDCKGNNVPCGKYNVVMNYNGVTIEKEVAITDANAVIVTGKASRDSLRSACRGKYFEIYEETPFSSEIKGICCQ